MIAAVAAIVVLVVVAAGGLVWWSTAGRRRSIPQKEKRVLVPFTGGELEPRVLEAAIRIARAEDATLVPAYLIVRPLQFAMDAPLDQQVGVAMPLLEAVEHAALREGIPVDARVESGRTATHALARLWDVEHFDRILAPAPVGRGHGLTLKDLTWILAHAPSETIILRPDPASRPANGWKPAGSPAAPAGAARRRRRSPRLPRGARSPRRGVAT